MLDMFRCGIKGKLEAKIHYYVMPHTPGNTPKSWRRQFYGDLAHGAKVLNLFEYRPVQAAYTENHCSDPAMYQAIRQNLYELGQFEDIIQDGQVRPGLAAIWKAIEKAYPDERVQLESWTRDHRKVVVLVDGARDGYAYALDDLDAKRGDWLGEVYPMVPQGQIAQAKAWIAATRRKP